MKTLKGKTMIGILLITVVLGILLNIIFRETVQGNFYNFIEKDLKNIKLILREQVNNEIVLNGIDIKENGMESKSEVLVDNLNRRLDCFIALCDEHGNVIYDSKDKVSDINKDKWFSGDFKDKISVHIEGKDSKVIGALKYPYYYEKKHLGTLVLEKDYSDVYASNKGLENIFTLVEIAILGLFLVIINVFVKRVTKPLNQLANEIKRVEKGDYGKVDIKHGRDEIGLVIENFNNMTREIKDKIDDINSEKEKIETLAKTQKEFFDNATHELKTPLTAISGYAQLLETKFHNEEFRARAISRIKLESDRLHKLVCEILTMSKERNSVNRKKEKLNIMTIVQEVVDDVKIIYESLDIQFNKIYDNEFYIYGVYEEVYQAFLNVLDNGAKYSKDNKIIIEGTILENKLSIKIKNGCERIPKDIEKDLFQPFVKHNFDRDIDSTGLGLYITKELVERNSGDITYCLINNEIEFNIEFPLV